MISDATGMDAAGMDAAALERQLELLAGVDADALEVLLHLAQAVFPDRAALADPNLVVWPERSSVPTGPGPAASDPERLEAMVARSENRFRALVSQIPAVVFLAALGADENEVFISPQIEEMLGYSAQEWLDDPLLWYRQLHPEDHAVVIEAFTKGVQTGGPFRAEVRFYARDGRERWILGEARLIRDEHGRPEYFQGIAFDVTADKEAQRLVSEVEQRRAEILAEANAELTRMNAELREAKEAAEESARARATFLATMSHELRTPLNSVIVLASLLAESELQPAQAQMVGTMQAAAEYLLELINDILEFSRLRAGRVELDVHVFSPSSWLRETVDIIAPRAVEKSLTLGTFVSPSLPGHVRADEGRLRQVLMNLVGNAVKFTPAGRVEVSLDGRRLEDGRWELTCTVDDTGPGVDAEVAQRLFDEFQQANAGIAREHGGTGLGLAISRQLMELMGGAVGLERSPLGGARFTMTWSCDEATAPAASDPSAPLGTAIPPSTRVLVAEDNELNRYVAELVLQAMGLRADYVVSGQEAVAAVERASFDVVLMDVAMPGMDGLEAARRIRALGDAVHQPRIVAMTAHALPGDREACLAAGMDDYVSKPIDRAALARALAADRSPVGARSTGTVASVTSGAIDPSTLEQVLADYGEPALLRLVDIYQREAPRLAGELVAAAALGDLASAAAAAHSLRSSAASVGALDLAARCRVLEDAVASGDPVPDLPARAAGIELDVEVSSRELEMRVRAR